jgi:hypothetical protein
MPSPDPLHNPANAANRYRNGPIRLSPRLGLSRYRLIGVQPRVAKYNEARPCDGVRRKVLLDLSPLRKHRDFRFVFVGQLVSGLFRMTIWNETIPSHLRGRMAAIEQLSYMTGPLLGNARAGFMAERFGLARSIVLGGLVCVSGVLACVPLLPGFWRYRKSDISAPGSGAAP